MVISTKPVYSQTISPPSMSPRTMDGLSRILQPAGTLERALLSFPSGSNIFPVSSEELANFQQRRVPRDAATIRNEDKRESDILSQIVIGGGAGFLSGILALRSTDQAALHVGAGLSLGALTSIPFYKRSDHSTRFVLYGAGSGGLAAGLLTLISNF